MRRSSASSIYLRSVRRRDVCVCVCAWCVCVCLEIYFLALLGLPGTSFSFVAVTLAGFLSFFVTYPPLLMALCHLVLVRSSPGEIMFML